MPRVDGSSPLLGFLFLLLADDCVLLLAPVCRVAQERQEKSLQERQKRLTSEGGSGKSESGKELDSKEKRLRERIFIEKWVRFEDD